MLRILLFPYEVVLPLSFLLCEDLGVIYHGEALACSRALVFSVQWESNQGSGSIVSPTFALPICYLKVIKQQEIVVLVLLALSFEDDIFKTSSALSERTG